MLIYSCNNISEFTEAIFMSKNNNVPEEENDQITLILEDDTELVCDVIAYFPCNGSSYVALLPADDEDSDYFLYRYEEREDDIELFDITDDDEYDMVADTFEEMLDSEEFDAMFDDDDED